MRKSHRSLASLLLCIAEIVVGILLLIDPIGFTSGILILLGIGMAIAGAFSLIKYFRTSPEEAALEDSLAKGLILVVLGCFCMFRSQWFIVTFPVLTALYGVMTLVNGIGKIQWAVDMLRQKQKYWFVAVIGAVLTILFAILILSDPFGTTAVLWTFIAISLIIEAVVDIVAFILGRCAPKGPETVIDAEE